MPQSVWWISTISRVPSRRWLIASERITSSETTPPALRITCASPSESPSRGWPPGGEPRVPDSAPMTPDAQTSDGPSFETDRLLLRPWRPDEAAVFRELWTERDPRVPPHRRIDADGRPTVDQLGEWIRTHRPTATRGLLAVELRETGEVIGYSGLVDGGRGEDGEPEVAFELLQRAWGQGYATEAADAVLGWARASGHRRVWATVWDWNTASRRVLAKLGFRETGRRESDPDRGTTLVTVKDL